MLVDTHVHVVARDDQRYPLRPNRPGLTWITRHACPIEEYISLMDANGVDRAVLVQAMGAYTDDNRYCVDSARSDRSRFTAVAYVDAHGADPTGALDTWLAEGAGGVRIVAITGSLAAPGVEALWKHAAARGVPIVATVVESEVPGLPALLERFPDARVALDHCGFPDLTGAPGYPNARPLFELAAFPNLHLKVSTIALDHARDGGGDPRGFVDALARAFGPHRLQWGSDWSQTHDRSFAELVAYAYRSFEMLGDDARWPLGDTARAFWFQHAGVGEDN
ncbi:MAG TPA: amidohydrolase family protein [Mycobacteriales bacterium]|nr:amidohydrolase family protein [Mycobacteriales bacterium]